MSSDKTIFFPRKKIPKNEEFRFYSSPPLTSDLENSTSSEWNDTFSEPDWKKEVEQIQELLTSDDALNKMIIEEECIKDEEVGSISGSNTKEVLSTFTSVLLLNVVAVIWGTQHAVVKSVLMGTDTLEITNSGFTFSRFLLAVLVVLKFTPDIRPFAKSVRRKLKNVWRDEKVPLNTCFEKDSANTKVNEYKDSITAWRWGSEIGLWMFLGYAFQSIGLAFTTAQRSGFLLYLNVKFVPFFAFILLSRQISVPTWISALTAFCGTALLSFGDSAQPPFNVGDVWSIAAAMASAMFILRMEKASSSVKNSASLNAACVWTVTTLAFFWTCVEGGISSIPESFSLNQISSWTPILMGAIQSPVQNVITTFQASPFSMLYLGIIATALTNYIQTFAQQSISAERASIIYAMDPVYGAFFANLFLGEVLGVNGIFGAALITLAAATNAFLDLGIKKEGEIDENLSQKDL